jgi:hypothetical protein
MYAVSTYFNGFSIGSSILSGLTLFQGFAEDDDPLHTPLQMVIVTLLHIVPYLIDESSLTAYSRAPSSPEI